MTGPCLLQRLERLSDGRAGAAGGLGDPLIAREAKPALGVMEGPEERLQHSQRFGCDSAIWGHDKIGAMAYTNLDKRGT
jgi:hypothetical protein